MATRAQKIRVGVLAVITAALLGLVLLVFAGLRFWEQENEYLVDFPGSVAGLEPGALVMLNGVRVGVVDSVATSPEDLARVRVVLSVKEDAPVRADTEAVLVMRGLTGLKAIDLRGGSYQSPELPSGSRIPAGATGLDQLEDKANAFADRALTLMDTADRALASAARVGAELETLVSENRVAVRQALDSVSTAANRVSRAMDRDLKKTLTSANSLLANVDGVVRQNQSQIRSAIADLRRATGNFKELSRNLRNRPSGLLFSKPPKDRALP
jgi:ABC-type transporter Mla subunit MlaD